MNFFKKFIGWASGIGLGTVAVNLASKGIEKKIKEKLEENKIKKEQERIYNEIKHNGIVKYLSFVFSLVALFLSILSIKQKVYFLLLTGLLSVIFYTITILYCLDIIKEKEHNTYKLFFMVSNMLLVITTTLFLF